MTESLQDDPRIPGRVAQCEWCGTMVNSFTDVPLHYCPNCHNGTLRQDCPHCGAPIAFPPQLRCLGCGKGFTLIPLAEVPGGYSHATIPEPESERRKELEVRGNNWYDVVRGKAEGPELKPLNIPPPPGWSKEEFDKALRGATDGDIPEEWTAQPQPPKQDAEPSPFASIAEAIKRAWTEPPVKRQKATGCVACGAVTLHYEGEGPENCPACGTPFPDEGAGGLAP